jgi:UDP-3-O-[3-hydroxymyristoyl] glucosamine N-acyltransferase
MASTSTCESISGNSVGVATGVVVGTAVPVGTGVTVGAGVAVGTGVTVGISVGMETTVSGSLSLHPTMSTNKQATTAMTSRIYAPFSFTTNTE